MFTILRTEGIKHQERKGALCLCECGKEFTARQSDLARGFVTSCGCRLKKHGLRKHPLYTVWSGMMKRCYKPSQSGYDRYSTRGITVFEDWHNPKTFIEYVVSTIGNRPEGAQLDRIDNNKSYTPGNIRWSTVTENQRNRSDNHVLTIGNISQCASAWSEQTGIHLQTILWRVRNGKTGTDIIAPVRKRK